MSKIPRTTIAFRNQLYMYTTVSSPIEQDKNKRKRRRQAGDWRILKVDTSSRCLCLLTRFLLVPNWAFKGKQTGVIEKSIFLKLYRVEEVLKRILGICQTGDQPIHAVLQRG